MMNRAFNTREKVLLLILTLMLLALGYYKLVHQPVEQAIWEAGERQTAAETELLVEAARLEQMREMAAELEALKAEGNEANAELPDYDNIENVMVELNTILSAAQQYSLTFNEIREQEEGLIARPIRLAYTARNYGAAWEILYNLYHCWYRCGISDITMFSEEEDISNMPVEVSVTVTFYERVR